MGGAAFALLKADGSVVAWGDPSSGGQLSRVQVSGLEINEFIGILKDFDRDFNRDFGEFAWDLIRILLDFGEFIGILVNEGEFIRIDKDKMGFQSP